MKQYHTHIYIYIILHAYIYIILHACKNYLKSPTKLVPPASKLDPKNCGGLYCNAQALPNMVC